MHFNLRLFCALLFAVVCCSAFRTEAQGTVTGLDISLESLGSGYYDREYRARGIVFDIVGIASLRPAKGAEVRARLGGKWKTFRTDERGIFEIDLHVPKEADFHFDDNGLPQLEMEVKSGSFKKEYEFVVTVESPFRAISKTDRKIYEPGETVHFWSRIDDAPTGRPLPGIPVTIHVNDQTRRETVTSASGVAALDYKLSKGSDSLSRTISIEAFGKSLDSAQFTVEKRATTDLLVTAEATPETIAPGEPFTVNVDVRSVRGTPMRGAEVSLKVSEQKSDQKTDANGHAVFHLRAPEYTEADNGMVKMRGTARHQGCRATDFEGSFHVRPPHSHKISVLVPHGALVPEVDERLIASVETLEGAPAKAGTIVELKSSAFEGFVARAAVDRYGFASFPIRLSREDYATHAAGDCSEETAITIAARIVEKDSIEGSADLCIPVSERVLVVPAVDKPAVHPGESFQVMIARRSEAADFPVSVSLICGDTAMPLETKVAGPSSNAVQFDAPRERLGICTIEARPLLDVNKGSTIGFGATEPILVRPSLPSFPSLSLDRAQYSVKGKALLTVHTPKGAPKSWAAVSVRDLAQHQGEVPFDEYFMNRELERAVLDPSTPEADRLIRVALIAFGDTDEKRFADQEDDSEGLIGTGEPFGAAMEADAARSMILMRKVTAGEWMVAVEALLEKSLDNGTVDQVTTGTGASLRFRADALNIALQNQEDSEEDTERSSPDEDLMTTDMLTDLDPSFTFENAAKRTARKRLVRLLRTIALELNPEENDETRPPGKSSMPPDRILSDLIRRGILSRNALRDPWGNTFVFQKTGRKPLFVFSANSEEYELLSPGPDGRIGTDDDIRDPWARAVPKDSLYAIASKEDHLMAELSAISPGSGAFEKLLAAYDRLNDEAVEELIGDGLLGGLGAGGGGSGYGSGYGTLGGAHKASAPSIRSGAALAAGRALAGVLREDFPATLYFKNDAPISFSGSTTLEIPLAHAATTYLVEAIVWREDGWRWSASTEIRVDQDLLVDAPLPESAILGDEVILPVRLSNRTDKVQSVSVLMTGTPELALAPVEIEAVRIPPCDTMEIPVALTFSKAVSGKVTFAALDEKHEPIDAVRRPIEIRPSKRHSSAENREILRGKGSMSLAIPNAAEPVGSGAVYIAVGSALFRGEETVAWSNWLNSLVEREVSSGTVFDLWNFSQLLEQNEIDPKTLAMMIGAYWTSADVEDSLMEKALAVLADEASKTANKEAVAVALLSRVLMGLAPAALHPKSRPVLARPLMKMVSALRVKVENGAALFADAPLLCAHAAAALYWTAPLKKAGKRAEELLKRAQTAEITIDGDPWLEGGVDDVTGNNDALFAASAFLALAEIRGGDPDNAYALLRSSAKLVHFDSSDAFRLASLGAEERMAAQAAAELLSDKHTPTEVKLVVDGQRYTVRIENGEGSLETSVLGRGGDHSINVKGAGRSILMMDAAAKVATDWDTAPVHVGPFVVRVAGNPGRADERSGLELVVRNRTPRMITEPVVEISVPTGAEVDEEARRILGRYTSASPTVSSDMLTLKLRPMRPKEEAVIPLPWLWTVAGHMTGLGAAAWAADREEAVSILPARKIEVEKRAETIGNIP